MNHLKFIVFIELITLLVVCLCHFLAKVNKEVFPLGTYVIVPVVTLVATLLVLFIIIPFGNWFFNI